MEDILASIRRILNEDEVAPASPEAGHPALPAPPAEANAGGSGGGDDDGVLVLDEAMLVSPTTPAPAPPSRDAEPQFPPRGLEFEHALAQPVATPEPAPLPLAEPVAGSSGLLAPESAAAAASAVGALLRTISEERTAQVHRGGPTIEDVVREEMRPLLKVWLDTHLPPMVERLVRQEIERVTGRAS